MERQVNIYALCDPDTENVRYIGQTVNMRIRFYDHLNKLHVGNKKKQEWIQSLLDQGKIPLMKIICVVDQSKANQAEMDAIAEAKLNGADLVNGTPRAFGGGRAGDVKVMVQPNGIRNVNGKTGKKLNPKKTSFVLTEESLLLLEKLSIKNGLTKTSYLEWSIRELCRREKEVSDRLPYA